MEHLIKISNFIHLLAIGVWLGSIIFFSFGVAGTLFKNLSSRSEAGKLNGIILKKLNKIELICIKLLFITFLIDYSQVNFRTDILFVRFAVFVVMAISTVTYSTYVTTESEKLKEKIINFDETTKDMPERKKFDRLHKLYVKMLSTNLFLGWALLYLTSINLKY